MKSVSRVAGGIAALAFVVSPGVVAFGATDTDGRALFGKSCASCHGADGKGSAKMGKLLKLGAAALDLTKETTQRKDDADLRAVVHKGQGKMPAFEKKLTGDQIGDLAAYVHTLAAAGKSAATAAPEPVRAETVKP